MIRLSNYVRCFFVTGMLLVSAFFASTWSQNLSFDHFSVNNGLSNSHLYAIYQDSTGFIWLGTEDGLNRFDGYSFRIYRNIPGDSTSIPDNIIHDLSQDAGDDFWIATNSGIARYISEMDRFQRIPFYGVSGQIRDVQVNKVIRTHQRKVFAATNAGLFEYNKLQNIFVPVKSYSINNPVVSQGNISTIFQDREYNLWIGLLNDGVWVYRLTLKKLEEISTKGPQNRLRNNKILCIYEDNQRIIWIGTENGLFTFDKDKQTIVRETFFLPPNLPHQSVSAVFEDSRNRLWIGTDGGLVRFRRDAGGTFTPFFHDDFNDQSLSNNAISCIYEDRQKNLWIGTKEGGINLSRLRFIQFNHICKQLTTLPGLNYAYALSVLEDKNGNLWVGTNGGGINFFSRSNNQVKFYTPKDKIPGGIQADAIQTICEDKTGNIWFGTYGGGLTVYNPSANTFQTFRHNPSDPASLVSDIVNTVYCDRQGRLWIGTHGGFGVLEGMQKKFRNYTQSGSGENSRLTSNFITVLYEDHNGNIWIGTYKGLNLFDPVEERIIPFFHSPDSGSLSSNTIYAICEDHNQRLWIGTGNGLNMYDYEHNVFTAYYEKDGLPNNTINGILEDDRGNLWISTNQGLSMFDPESKRFVNFNMEDGLANVEFHHGSFARGKSGNFYFGSKKGVTYFNPNLFSLQSFVYPLVITDFRIFNTTVEPGTMSPLSKAVTKISDIVLKHNQSYIAIGFSALNYVNPGKDQYSYFLEGYDYGWVRIQNYRYASYSNLPPGRYTLQLRVVNGITGITASKNLHIIVKPPFWKSPFSYFVYFLFITLLIYLGYSYIKARNLFKQNLLMERIEKEKIKEVNQTKLRFFINVSHEFKTPLTLILSPLEKLMRNEDALGADDRKKLYRVIYRNAGRLSRLINQIMDLRKLDAGKIELNASETDLVEFVHTIARYFKEHAAHHAVDFSVVSELDKLPVWVDREKFEKVLFNLISNAFKFTHDGGKIQIKLSTGKASGFDGDAAIICISDTGIGIPEHLQGKIFERFYQVPADTTHSPSSSGIGLSIAREFVDLHRGRISVTSKPGEGSVFCVFLPLGNRHLRPEEIVMRDNDHFLPSDYFVHEEDVDETLPENRQETQVADPGRPRRKILIVEDNYELRNFLMDNLEGKFDVYEAADGEEGLKMVYDILPEIVVSDVMMPKMSGIELCRAVKSDVRISHIPVILITVLHADRDRIEGLESGADDYLAKPFSLRVLELKISNIIENRQKLVRKFLQDLEPDLRFMARTKTDENFLQRATEIVEKHLAEPEFSAEEFSREMGMSRSNVHVKLRALANQSTTEFIRTLRLKKAAVLLMTGKFNISEVSFQVGFNNISYFNRCFKKHFGMTPSEYLDKTLSNKKL